MPLTIEGNNMPNHREKAASGFLHCAPMLEELAFKLYRSTSNRVYRPDASALLLYIGYDSLKAAAILRVIATYIPAYGEDCRKYLNSLFDKVEALLQQVTSETMIENNELSQLMKRLAEVERELGEKYESLLQTKTLQYLADEIGRCVHVDLNVLTAIFEALEGDKENHNTLLVSAAYCIESEHLETAIDNTPTVRYQNPDGWNRPILI